VKTFPQKSRLKHIAHNPTGELIRIITEKFKENKKRGYETNSRTNSK